jgi:Der1-like family
MTWFTNLTNVSADYLFMLLFNWICSVTIGLFMNLSVLMDPMVLSVLYVWCQLNKDQVSKLKYFFLCLP